MAREPADPTDVDPLEAKRLAEELRTLLDVLPVGVFIAHDRECTSIRGNPAGEAMLGLRRGANASLTSADAASLPFRVRRDGEEVAPEDLPMQRAARLGVAVRGEELEIEHEGGRVVHLFEYASPLVGEDGRVRGALGVFVDITERKRAEETRALLAAIVASSDDAILSMTPGGAITSWNAGAERLYGWRASEMLGQPLSRLVPADRLGEDQLLLARVLKGERVQHFRTARVTKDGTLVDVSIGVSPVRDSSGRIVGASKVARDVSEQLRAERALRESEERYRRLLRSGRDALFVYPLGEDGVPGRFVEVNDEACRRLGYSREELLRMSVADVADVPAARVAEILRELRSAGRTTADSWHRTRDGRRIPVEVNGEIVTIDGRPHVLTQARDVTERRAVERALRASEARYRRIFDQVAVGIGREGLDRVMTEANPGLCHMLGYTAEELVGREASSLTHPEDEERSGEAMRALAEGLAESVTVEKRLCHKAGHYVWVQITASVERDAGGTPRSIVGVVQDITSRKLAEDELRQADRRKDDFLAVLAHELRNPLAPISHAAELLARLPSDHPARPELVRIVGDQSRHVARLVDDLLDVSRISRGKIELRPELVALDEVLAGVVEAARPLVEEAEHELEVRRHPEPLLVLADRVRLAQVLSNLLSNAVKYTPRGGRIEIETARAGADAAVRVRDDGVGIPPERIDVMFEMFRQIEGGEGIARSGLGIGLTLARQLVELHGGEIHAESPGRGRGSTFTVTLPLQAAGAEPPPTLPAPAPGRARGERLRVLVVDDAAVVADTLALMIESLGHDVRTCTGGAAAVLEARVWRPDVVVSDLAMPGVDGFEVARRLRADEDEDGPRLVALSGYGNAEARERTAAAGFHHHLVKPATLADLEAVLARR